MLCSFCKTKIPDGTGKIVVTKAGKTLYFCSGKCEKNMLKLGRSPNKLKWTRKANKKKGADRSG
ncbi:MAG: 50S ribosomal protein L24e [Candidatus Diapherotrites archaeon]